MEGVASGDGETAGDGLSPSAVDAVGKGVGVTPGIIGRQVAKRIAPTTAITTISSGDTRRGGVAPGGVPPGVSGGVLGGPSVPAGASCAASGGAWVEPPSDAPLGVGVRTVGLSSAMSATV